jgi:hypothetical protein
MKLSELKPADYNPRVISDRALAGLGASMDRFGMVEPIVWNRRSGRIVGGHQRLKVMVSRGIEETEVMEVDLDEVGEKALNLALNNPSTRGEFTDGATELISRLESSAPDLVESMRMDELKYLVERLKTSRMEKCSPGDSSEPGLDGRGKKGLECPKCHCAFHSETGRVFRKGAIR